MGEKEVKAMKIIKIVDKIKKRTRNMRYTKELSYENLKKLIRNNSDIIIVDVRSPQEFAENRINSSINIPVYDIEHNAVSYLRNRNSIIIVYCQSGVRSKKACTILEKLGYTNVYNLTGGLNNI